MQKMKDNNQNQKFPGFPPEISKNFWCFPRVLDNYTHTLNGSEHKVLFFILRHTWGFNKDCDEISLTQLENGVRNLTSGTGLSRPTIIKSTNSLIKKGFIKKTHGNKANSYKLVKDFNYPHKESLPIASKKSLHTIDNNTIKNKQYISLSDKEKIDIYKSGGGKKLPEKPYFREDEMRWVKRKGQYRWEAIKKGEEKWLEFAGQESEIEWRKK